MTRHLLIDADVLVYKAACACEKAFEWDEGQWTYQADEMEARDAVDREIAFITEKLGGDKVTLALTDGVNFRKAILPTYKANRKSTRKPLVLKPLRQWLLEERGAKVKPGLEGDDVLGILATMKHSEQRSEERIIVSVDKDMKTIPGRYAKDDFKVVEVTEQEADRWHLIQTLTGDVTDGYKGCPGIGIKKAEAIIGGAGDVLALGIDTLWPIIVQAYEKAGLDEAEALTQARVARILRASDFNFKTQEPILWEPR